MKQLFILPGVTLSQNQWDKLHWAERYRIRNDWFENVKYVCGVQPIRQAHKCRVTIVRVGEAGD